MVLSEKTNVKRLDVILFLIFMSFLCVITSGAESDGVQCIDRERAALLKFQARLIDDYGYLSTWGTGDNKRECCKWTGIRCDNQTNHVVLLDLQGTFDENPFVYQTLRGKISPSLLELVDISYLDLSNNDFGTAIPNFIGSFRKLQHLNLSSSRFIGSIPTHLGNMSMLQTLDLGRNYDLYAKDLDWLSGFHSLQHLDLTNVNLEKVGTSLKTISKLTYLKKLYMSECGIHETLSAVSNVSNSLMVLDLSSNNLKSPTFLWFLNLSSHYVYMDLQGNNLEGKIPDALTNLTSLSHLYLSSCKLEGSIPDTIGNMISLLYLDLSGNQLHGNIPDDLGKLMSLSYLDLSSNNIEGEIPDGLGKLMSISYLDLSHNILQGGFPRSPGNLSYLVSLQLSWNKLDGDLRYMYEFLRESTMLEYLDLSVNSFYGSVPSLSRLSSLTTLNLRENKLNGSFTDHKLRLPHLKSLDVTSNRLNGRLPDFSPCSSLETLGLSENNFNRTLTETIGYLYKLQFLDLHSNDFEGAISEAHLFNLSTLLYLDVSFNSLLSIRISSNWTPPFQLGVLKLANCSTGPSFPKWLRTQRQMEFLDISSSQIYDTVPGWFWDNSYKLRSLNMSFNHIYGVIPNAVLSECSTLDLRSNEFNGSLPYQPGYTYLDVSRNRFSGEITEFCKHMYTSAVLDFSDNQLSGQLSKQCFMNLLTHAYLNLASNYFSGKIPSMNSSSFCGLTALHLRNNSFTGKLPISLGDCNYLEILDLGNNYFTGKIPTWIGKNLSHVRVISLRSNKFSGTLPSNLCFLANIQVLDMSMNHISGTIPRCLNNFTSISTKPTSLENYRRSSTQGVLNNAFYDNAYIMWKGQDAEYANTLWQVKAIDFSSNDLVGEIPTEITSLEGLIALNLSRNRLVGTIPRDIDKLEFLNFLDLSHNNLSGSIPTTFSELNHLGMMDLSFNNLSGKIPWNTHLETFGSNAFLGNPRLCGPPISQPCPEDQIPQIPKSARSEDHLTEDEDMYITKGFFISMAIGFILAFWGIFGTLTFSKSCRIRFIKLFVAFGDWWYVKTALNMRALQQYFQ